MDVEAPDREGQWNCLHVPRARPVDLQFKLWDEAGLGFTFPGLYFLSSKTERSNSEY